MKASAHPAPAQTNPRPGFPWLVAASLGAAVALLGGGILLTQAQLRSELRAQIAHRDAQTLGAIVQQQLSSPADAQGGDPLPALLEALLVPDLPGVLAVQLYDPTGQPTLGLLSDPSAQPPSFEQFRALAEKLTETDLKSGESPLPVVAEFRETAQGPRLNVLLALTGASTGPSASQASTPPRVAFTLDGASLAAEYVQLDQTLRRRNWSVFGLLGSAMLIGLGFTFQRLIRTQHLLQQRTLRLEAANRELTLSAKTSAVGAVTAHLVHGLKNPLLGLQQYVQSLDSGGIDLGRTDAAASARQMKAMIDDVVRVLRDEQGLTAFELSAAELLSHVHQRCSGPAQQRKVHLELGACTDATLTNRCANLAALILENLITNAIQAVPSGGTVRLSAATASTEDSVVFEVCDNGPGLDATVREHLFQPGASTKAQGTGLGLALSQQLARSVDGEIALASSDAHGTRFTLRIPTAHRETV